MSDLDHVSRANPDYVEEQYRRYRADPRSVDEGWALFFAGFDMALGGNGLGPHGGYGPNAGQGPEGEEGAGMGQRVAGNGYAAAVPLRIDPKTGRTAEPVLGVFGLVHAYRELG